MTDEVPALGICLEEYEYPYPVRFLPLSNDLQPVSMAYMDIPPSTEPNGQTAVLFHGELKAMSLSATHLGQARSARAHGSHPRRHTA